MNKNERLDAFRYAPDHPLYRAFMEMLEEHIQAAALEGVDPELSDREVHMSDGGAAALTAFVEDVEDLVKEAARVGDSDEESAGD